MPLTDIYHDFNGEYYVAGASGEIEESKAHRLFFIWSDDAERIGRHRKLDLENNDDKNLLTRTVVLNYWMQVSTSDGQNVKHEAAWKIAFGRGLLLRLGLVDASGGIVNHGYKYDDVVRVSKTIPDPASPNTQIPYTINVRADDVPNKAVDEEVNPLEVDIPEWTEEVNSTWRKTYMLKFTDVICICAFFFRTRAHHGKDEFWNRFSEVWRKCLYDENEPGLSWELITHNTMHVVYADTLDEFWLNSVDAEHCAGALSKRVNSYAAGTAAYGAVAAGAMDVVVVFPRLRELLEYSFEELDRCANVLDADGGRWVGSLNRRFYGATNYTINERALAPLAAVIVGALKVGAVAGRLKDSKALERVANAAPITGSMVTSMLQKASQHDRMVYAVLPPADEED